MDVEQLHGIVACQKDDVLFHHWHGESTLGIDYTVYQHSFAFLCKKDDYVIASNIGIGEHRYREHIFYDTVTLRFLEPRRLTV